jgi:hypothetical protein
MQTKPAFKFTRQHKHNGMKKKFVAKQNLKPLSSENATFLSLDPFISSMHFYHLIKKGSRIGMRMAVDSRMIYGLCVVRLIYLAFYLFHCNLTHTFPA